MDENRIVHYWLVQLGKLYCAGGLARKAPNHVDAFSYEFVNDESLARPFPVKFGADVVAEKCGGTVLSRSATAKQFLEMYERNEKYVDSALGWLIEQERAILEDLKPQHNKVQ